MRAAGARGVATEGGVQLYLRPTQRSEGHYAMLPVCAPTDDSNEWTCPDICTCTAVVYFIPCGAKDHCEDKEQSLVFRRAMIKTNPALDSFIFG